MGFSDDHASPAAPFFGDETGEIFETPDVVFHSPTTTERVVDTQSGFLVVVKRIDGRLALSVKRRLGTPPVSSILLTPDESLKLSRILAGPLPAGAAPKFKATVSERQPEADEIDFSAESEQVGSGKHEGNGNSDPTSRSLSIGDFRQTQSEKSFERLDSHLDDMAAQVSDSTDRSRSWSTWDKLSGATPAAERSTLSTIVTACLIVGALALGVGGTTAYFLHFKKPAPAPVVAPVESAQAVEARQIDKLAREYITQLLDFNPATYRYSQVRAMANMTPELMGRYWKETHFPLTLGQLRMATRNDSVVVSKVELQPLVDPASPQVDVFANMVGADNKTGSAVHLQLSLEKGLDNTFKVSRQEDLSNKK